MTATPAFCEAKSGEHVCGLTLLMIKKQPGGADALRLKRWLETDRHQAGGIIGCLVDLLQDQPRNQTPPAPDSPAASDTPDSLSTEDPRSFTWSE